MTTRQDTWNMGLQGQFGGGTLLYTESKCSETVASDNNEDYIAFKTPRSKKGISLDIIQILFYKSCFFEWNLLVCLLLGSKHNPTKALPFCGLNV